MMAHFAEVDPSWNVLRVIVVANEDILDENGVESEALGVAFCKNLFGEDSRWLQTSYNNNFRKNFAGSRSIYDPGRDAFFLLQPYPSWILEEETCWWYPPVPYPEDSNPGEVFIWDEASLTWIEE